MFLRQNLLPAKPMGAGLNNIDQRWNASNRWTTGMTKKSPKLKNVLAVN